jgi:peptidyl-prolyl cis-trans isomerase C
LSLRLYTTILLGVVTKKCFFKNKEPIIMKLFALTMAGVFLSQNPSFAAKDNDVAANPAVEQDEKKIADDAAQMAADVQKMQADTRIAKPTLPDDSAVVASIDGKEMTIGDVKNLIEMNLEGLPKEVIEARLAESFPEALEGAISFWALVETAKKEGLDKDIKIQKKIDFCQKNVLKTVILDKKVATSATDTYLKGRYNEILPELKKAVEGQKQVQLAALIFATKEEAEKALKDLKGGTDFNDMKKKYPTQTDDQNNVSGYVDMNWVDLDTLSAPLPTADIGDAPKASTIMKVVDLGPKKNVIFRVVDKREKPIPTFEQFKPNLIRQVYPLLAIQAAEDLKKNFKVKRFGLDGKPMDAPKLDLAQMVGGQKK